MIHFYLDNAQIAEATPSSGKKFYVLHPANNAILAATDTREEAELVVEGLNNYPEAMRRTAGVTIK